MNNMDRKKFLTTGLLGLGAALSLPTQLLGQGNKTKKTKSVKKIITIEEHFILKSISQKVAQFYTQQNGGISINNPVQKELMAIVLPTNDDIEAVGERRIKFMDESGIDMQVLSYGAGSPQNISDKSLAIKLCKEATDQKEITAL